MRRSTIAVLAGWLGLSGAGFSAAQVGRQMPPGETKPLNRHQAIAAGQGARPVWIAVLKTIGGAKAKGEVRLDGDEIVLTRKDGKLLKAKLAEIASLEVIPPQDHPGHGWGNAAKGGLPAPWRSVDVGRPSVPGRATWQNNQFVLQASARARGERLPSFHMAYMPMEGDGEIAARIVTVGSGDENSCAGVIMCSELEPGSDAAVLSVGVHGKRELEGKFFLHFGSEGGSSSGHRGEATQLPQWLRLVRDGTIVNAYYARNDGRWQLIRQSPCRVKEGRIYVGLVAHVLKSGTRSKAVIDSVSVNGRGDQTPRAILPQVVLTGGSVLSAKILEADRTSFTLGGEWRRLRLTTPRIARVEFFPPLPEDVEKLVDGSRSGLLMRSGDFLEGDFERLAERKVKLSSVLFGAREYPVAEMVDALVLRPAAPPKAGYRVETRDGSILHPRQALFRGSKLRMEVDGVGKVQLALEEIRDLRLIGEEGGDR